MHSFSFETLSSLTMDAFFAPIVYGAVDRAVSMCMRFYASRPENMMNARDLMFEVAVPAAFSALRSFCGPASLWSYVACNAALSAIIVDINYHNAMYTARFNALIDAIKGYEDIPTIKGAWRIRECFLRFIQLDGMDVDWKHIVDTTEGLGSYNMTFITTGGRAGFRYVKRMSAREFEGAVDDCMHRCDFNGLRDLITSQAFAYFDNVHHYHAPLY